MKKKLKLKSLHFAVGALVIGAFLPIFIKNDYYMMVLNRVLINIIVVLGLNFITGLTGQMNLGTAGIFALGAYSSALFTRYRARRKCITCFWYLPPLLFLLPGALPIPSGGGFSNPCGIMWRQWR